LPLSDLGIGSSSPAYDATAIARFLGS